MYSGTYVSNTNAYRDYGYTDENLYIDMNAFKDYIGRYIFSRVKINNADELQLTLVNKYTDEKSPYTLYLYQTNSWFSDSKVHTGISYEDRDMNYDIEAVQDVLNRINEAAEAANAKAEGLSEEERTSVLTETDLEQMEEMYQEIYDLIRKMSTSYSIMQIEFFKDVNDEEMCDAKDELFEYLTDYSDLYLQALRSLANSPYEEFLKGKLYPSIVDDLKEYEDMTEEEKERDIKLQSLSTEYEQAASEDYYFDYNGKTIALNSIKLGSRDSKGTKIRV